MSRKTDFEKFALTHSNVKEIRAAGMGESLRVVVSALEAAVKHGHAAAVSALVPLAEVSSTLLEQIVQTFDAAVLKTLPKNCGVVNVEVPLRFIMAYGIEDTKTVEIVRLARLSNADLTTVAENCLAHHAHKTLELALRKNSNTWVAEQIFINQWFYCVPLQAEILLRHSKNLKKIDNELRTYNIHGQHQPLAQRFLELLEEESVRRQHKTLTRATTSTPSPSPRKKM